MRILRTLISAAALGSVGALAEPSAVIADPHCPRCDIVEAGLLNDRLVGSTAYLLYEGDFYPVQIVAIYPGMPAVRWRSLDDGREGNDDARNYFSASSVDELRRSGDIPLSHSEDVRRTSILAACTLWKAQERDDNSGFLGGLLELQGYRACCTVDGSDRWAPPGLCR